MKHLSPEQLIDLVDGVRADVDEPHLQACQICRDQLEELRSVFSVASGAEVPEPSPLFWNHFSARVRDAVSAEGGPRPTGWWGWLTLAAGVVAAVIVVVGPSVRRPELVPEAGRDRAGIETPATLQALAVNDDATLSLMADLATDGEWAAALESGVETQTLGADAVGMLTDGERAELERLLKEALAKPGA